MKRLISLFCALFALPMLFSCNPQIADTAANTDYSMTATVTELGEKILVEVTESPTDMTGPYHINTDKGTVYCTKDGTAIRRSDIAVGDTVVIYYGGQVMMSYPAQVYAAKIVKK